MPVSHVRVAAQDHALQISWLPSELGAPATMFWVQVGDHLESTADSQLLVSGLRNGQTYDVIVYAATEDGRSEGSDPVSGTPLNGSEGEVAGLIVEFAPGVSVDPGQEAVPGESKTSVEMTAAQNVTDSTILVEFAEPVSLGEASVIAVTMEADPRVEWAEPDQFLFTAAESAPAPRAWNLDGAYGVDAPAESVAGQGVTVAVIDTGSTNHPALQGKTVAGYDFVSSPDALSASRQANAPPVAFDGDYVDTAAFGALGRDANPSDPGDWRGVTPVRDSSWHGTQIAGVISSVVPGASIEPIRALSWRGGLLSDIASSITWASGGSVDGAPTNPNPAKVINMSFSVETMCPTALQAAIDDARSRGAILVAAAGNAGDDAAKYAPGNCNGVITVAATGSNGARASYSNYGSVVDIAAPGGDTSTPVTTTSNSGTTTPSDSSASTSFGTSIAAAHVSAGAALIAASDRAIAPDTAYAKLAGKDYVKDFAAATCDTNPDYSCGSGILSLVQAAALGDSGSVDKYMTFNGVNQRAKGATGYFPVDASSGGSFTVEAWVYDTNANGYWQYVMSQGADGAVPDFDLGTVNGSQEIHLGGWWTGVLLPTDQWVHLAVSRSSSTATLYMNGYEVAYKDNYAPLNDFSGQPFRIGSYMDDRAEYWQGRIDNVKIYNTALSQAQILADMENHGMNAGVSSSYYKALYDFNEDWGSTVYNMVPYAGGYLNAENAPGYGELGSSSTSGTTTTVTIPRTYLTKFGGYPFPAGVTRSTALIVGGGGGGGWDGGGGGGGGGFYQGPVSFGSGGTMTAIVGQGGVARRDYNPSNHCRDGNYTGAIGCSGNSGTTSQLAGGTVTGGGGGGGKNAAGSNYGGIGSLASGSGGGGGPADNFVGRAGGVGRFDGGLGGNWRMGGGGGGFSQAGSVGTTGDYVVGGAGGAGWASALSGTYLVYGSGGGAGVWGCINCVAGAQSGAGMGGWGGMGGGFATPNQGGGGGGGGSNGNVGGYGGSGIIVATYTTTADAPTSFTATAGSSQASLSWTAPAYYGSSAITGYYVQYVPSGGSWTNPSAGTCSTASSSTSTSCTITGLTAGTSYSFQIAAITGAGTGSWVQANSVTPYGTMSKFAVTMSGGTTALSAVPKTAGTPFLVRVTAQDSAGNTATGFTGTVALTSTAFSGTVNATISSGGLVDSVSLTPTIAGASRTITTVSGAISTASASAAFTVNAGAATKLQALLPGETAAPGTGSGKSGSPTGVNSGTPVTLTVNAVDANWNVITTSTPTVHLTSTDGAAVLPADAALVAGTGTFAVTFNSTGAQTVTAADTAGSSPLASATTAPVDVRVPQAQLTLTSQTSVVYGDTYTLTTSGGSGTGAMDFQQSGGSAACLVGNGWPSASTLTGSNGAGGTCEIYAFKDPDANYQQAISPAQYVSVTARPIEITADSSSITYPTAVTQSYTISSGSLGMSDAISGITYTYVGTGATSYGPSTTAPTSAGTYSVIPSAMTLAAGRSTSNYSIQYVTGTVTISQGSQSIGFNSLTPVTYGAAPFALTASATSGLTVSYSSSDTSVCSVSGDILTVVGGGTCNITASQAGNENYTAANSIMRILVVNPATQATLTMSSASSVAYGGTITLATAGGSGAGAVTYAGTCSISGGVVTAGNAGTTCTVTATKAATANYQSASSSAQTITFTQAGQVLSFTSSVPTNPVSGGTYAPVVVSNSTITGTNTSLTPSLTVSGTCSLASGTVTFTAIGTCTVTANSGSTSNYTAATAVTQSILVGALNQTINFPQPANRAYGSAGFAAGATVPSMSNVTYALGVGTTNSACSVSALGAVTILAVGTCEIVASAAADAQYAAASNVTRAFQVVAATATAPSLTSASASSQAITVAFTAPGFTGGVAITGYSVVATPTGAGTVVTTNACATTSPCTISGLENGTEYTVTVAAINSAGTGAASSASTPLTPATTAYAVGAFTATPGDTTVALSWTPLTTPQLGGGSFTRYEISMRTAGGSTWTSVTTALTTQSTSSYTVTSLDNGTSYDFQIVAITTANSMAITGNTTTVIEYPSTVPSAPRSLNVSAATATDVQFSWMAPLSIGGAALSATNYAATVTSTITGAVTPITCTTSGALMYCTASGLTNGALYTFSVVANNRMGSSAPATITYAVPSSDATLSNLVVTGAGAPLVLTPTFVSGTLSYTAQVPFSTSSVTVTATTTMSGSTMTINTVAETSGVASAPIALTVGANSIDVLVTASDPRHTRTYTVTVTRQPDPTVPSSYTGPSTGLPVPVPGGLMTGSLGSGGSPFVVVVGGMPATGVTGTRATQGNGWQLSAPGYGLTVTTRTVSGAVAPMSASGALRAPQGGSVVIYGTDFMPSSSVAVFAIELNTRASGDPVYLGSTTVSASGVASATMTIPMSLQAGDYALQVNGLTTANTVRSANLALEVYSEQAEIGDSRGKSGKISRAAFFKAGSDVLSRAGRSKLASMVKAVPASASRVAITVIGVSVSKQTPRENLKLARERAQRIVTTLQNSGLKGTVTVSVYTTFELRSAQFDKAGTPVKTSSGKPLTTATISFVK